MPVPILHFLFCNNRNSILLPCHSKTLFHNTHIFYVFLFSFLSLPTPDLAVCYILFYVLSAIPEPPHGYIFQNNISAVQNLLYIHFRTTHIYRCYQSVSLSAFSCIYAMRFLCKKDTFLPAVLPQMSSHSLYKSLLVLHFAPYALQHIQDNTEHLLLL